MAPTSKIRPTAEYDAAAALIKLKDWDQAAKVLVGFRKNFPGHPLQPEVTKKIAYVYKENNQLSLAADEYERIEKESKDDEIRRESLLIAADLHEKSGDSGRALAVYRRYVDYFPQPVDINLETRNKIAGILKTQNDRKSYLKELEQIVAIDASAGSARTSRTRYLAGNAALVLAENTYETFLAVKLVKPLKVNLQKKKGLMKQAIDRFNSLLDYESGELTAAATFYLAEIYAHFSKALMTSERPVLTFDYYRVKPGDTLSAIAKRNSCDVSRIVRENNLNKSNFIVAGKKLKIPRGLYPVELEQYELALEEQAYPFEEKAIKVHQSNLALITKGVYNEWIDKSLQKLAKLVPARYDKPEETIGIVSSLETFKYEIARPAPVSPAAYKLAAPAKAESSASVTKVESEPPSKAEKAASVTKVEPAAPAKVEEAESNMEPKPSAHEQVEQPGSVTKVEPATPTKVEESGAVTASEPGASENVEETESDNKPKSAGSEQVEQSGSVTKAEPAAPENVKEAGPGTEVKPPAPAQVEKSGSVKKAKPAAPEEVEESGSVTAPEPGASGRVEGGGSDSGSKPPTSAQAEQTEFVTETETVKPAQIEKPVQDEATAQTDHPSGAGKETQR